MDFLDRMRSRRHDRLVGEWMEARHARLLLSQDDLVVANAAGATVRADINANLQALGSLMAGAAAPGTTYAYMLWSDTTNNVLKRRNAANSAWIVERSLAEVFLVDRSSDAVLALADYRKTFRVTGSYTQTVTAAATLTDGWFCDFRVEGGATLTIDPNAAETVDGATTKVIVGPASGTLRCNGTAFYTRGFERIILATEQATTSGTSIDFTSIPAGVRRITMSFVGVSTSGTSVPILQLGDSGGVETTGYVSLGVDLLATPAVTNTASTAGFALTGAMAGTRTLHGCVVLSLEDASDNTWAAFGLLHPSNVANVFNLTSGTKALSATLDRVRLTTAGGSDTFDAGAVNISYEF